MQYWWCLSVIIFGISYILFTTRKSNISNKESTSHYEIIVGVLSSRENFRQRQIIRDGIRNQNLSSNILIKFIVSSKPCYIPLQDRISVYSCNSLTFLKPSADSFVSHHMNELSTLNIPFISDVAVGLEFEVNHPIVVNKLGFFDYNLDGFKSIIKVVLYETTTQRAITAATFTQFSSGHVNGLYRFKSVQEFVLPKGFHGVVVVHNLNNDFMIKSADCHINDGDGLIRIIKGYRFGNTGNGFPIHINKYVNSTCFIAATSFVYSAHDVGPESNGTELALHRLERYRRRKDMLVVEEKRLQNEENVYNDLLITDTVEHYRNLPNKLLDFYTWLDNQVNFNFVLKSDDDCYLNISGIVQVIQEELQYRKQNIWLGSFRENFPLDKHGKWAEYEYLSNTYPPFACGSGYVLSSDVVHWITMNRKYLKIYQGEDVSLGIWLASIGVDRIHNNRFYCFRACSEHMLASPEHSLSELNLLYKMNNIDSASCQQLNEHTTTIA